MSSSPSKATTTNLAGLELCTDEEKLETVCALGDGNTPTRCVTASVSSDSGCGPGVEPESEADKELVAEAKAGWSRTAKTRTWLVTGQQPAPSSRLASWAPRPIPSRT